MVARHFGVGVKRCGVVGISCGGKALARVKHCGDGVVVRRCDVGVRRCGLVVRRCGVGVRHCGVGVRRCGVVGTSCGGWALGKVIGCGGVCCDRVALVMLCAADFCPLATCGGEVGCYHGGERCDLRAWGTIAVYAYRQAWVKTSVGAARNFYPGPGPSHRVCCCDHLR